MASLYWDLSSQDRIVLIIQEPCTQKPLIRLPPRMEINPQPLEDF